MVVPKKWFIATRWGTVYTCTIQMLYFSMGFQEKMFFFHPRRQLFLTASAFPTTACLSENYIFEIAFLPDQTAFFPDPNSLTHCHTGQTTTYFLQKKMVETTKILVFSNSCDFFKQHGIPSYSGQTCSKCMEHHGNSKPPRERLMEMGTLSS